ncbi:MAG TPA: UbiA family prenyltransferase [Abditibacteriaceae bacterium]|jgi:4-hydroxybenzoate polyprenyltransferase
MRLHDFKTLPVPAASRRLHSRGKALWLNEVLFTIKASRPGFWLTAIWFYLLPLGRTLPLSSFDFWLGLVYVALPLGLVIYAANDLTDERTDSLNPRKDSFLFGARPTPQQIANLPLRIILVQVPFLMILCWFLGPRALVWFGAVVGITTLYNVGAKNRPFFDTIAQVGYLTVFVLAHWLNNVPFAAWQLWVFGALFAMHSHLFGEIMDIEPDRAAERQTSAVVIGTRSTKLVVAALLVVETFLATTIAHKPWLPFVLAMGAILFLLDAAIGWRERSYPTSLVAAFFVGWNFFLLAEIGLTLAR